jgi:hypothetical protein
MSFEYDRTETARIVKRPPSCSCFRMRNNEIISTACKLHDKGFKDVPDKKAPSKRRDSSNMDSLHCASGSCW